MKVIIAGSRGVLDTLGLDKIAEGAALFAAAYGPITTVLCGDARGIDRLGAQWAAAYAIPVEHFPANWTAHGRAAGHIRNAVMVQKADGAIFVWDGFSRGTKGCIALAETKDIPHLVLRTDQ